MPKPKKGPRLGGSAAHERLIIRNLCRELIEHRAIVTTEAKARRVQPVMEKLITKAKRGDDHARRQAYAVLRTNTAKRSAGYFDYVYELFDVIAKEFDPDREGGYTRIVKLPSRRGDRAPQAQISLVMEKVAKKATVKEAEKTAAAAADAEAKEAEAAEETATTETEEAQVSTEDAATETAEAPAEIEEKTETEETK
ncbi:MAG: 50S ribosomal protein L17 [Actinomycetaceae bacterium]|nr:50S ribosomal protein L17 [Actinomycetaceae bacterium]